MVKSSVLASVGYDEATAALEVAFVDGSVYRYFGVPDDVYIGLIAAPSHGAFFEAEVKQAGYRYAKVA